MQNNWTKIKTMGKATNENNYKTAFRKKYSIELSKSKYYKSGNFKISVDCEHSYNGKTYLFEIDSYPFDKAVIGQYLLLNEILEVKKNVVFIVINSSKRNRKQLPKKTSEYLCFVKEIYQCEIPFISFEEKEIETIIQNNTLEGFFKHIETFKIN